jgi:hypothetical protein
MLIGMLAVIVAVFGALIYLLCSPSPHTTQVGELGRLAYHAAMIGLMVAFAAKVIRLLN